MIQRLFNLIFRVISCSENSCGLSLDWKTKRFYHIQLEILLNALQAIAAKFTPLIFLALSVMACASAVMLLHINPTSEDHGCAYCAFLFLVVCTWNALMGGFFAFELVEQLSEASAAVLGEINESVMSEAMASGCVYGGQLIRRGFAARLFRRCILRVRMGEFRKIEPGFGLEFFQMTTDNIVAYIYMVNSTGKMWLL